jgi:hypothetical protein
MSSRPCPSCGQPLDGSNDPAATVRCSRCGTVVDLAEVTGMGAVPPPPKATPRPPRKSGPPGLGSAGHAALPRLPGYEALEVIGKGRHGVVFKARQTGLNRLVAIKVIESVPGGPEEVRRFRHEAETLLRLDHESIVPTLDVIEGQGRLFFTMELCPGGSLEARLAQGPLPPAEAVSLVRRLARAAQAAHDKGVVHGDLTASDVLWDAAGAPKLTGLGQARLMTGQESGPEADVAALGRLLRRCVGTPEPALQVICDRCEASEEATRYRGARELADDLERVQAAMGQPAARRGAAARLFEPLSGRWPVVPMLIALFLVLTGSLAALAYQSGRASLPVDLSAADVWLGAEGGSFENSPSIDLQRADSLRRQRGIVVTDDCIVGEVSWWKPGESRVRVLVIGSDSGGTGLGPVGALGRRLRWRLQEENAVVVCRDDLDRLGLPDKVDEPGLLAGEHVRVVGNVGFPASPIGPLVFCSLDTARKLLRMRREETTFVLLRCNDPTRCARNLREVARDGLQVRDRAELSLGLRLRWLTSAPLAHAWAGTALALVLAAAPVLARLVPRQPREPRRFAWARLAFVVTIGALLADAIVRAALAVGWPDDAHLFPARVLEGGTAALAVLLALIGGACLRRPRAAAPAPPRGRLASRAR